MQGSYPSRLIGKVPQVADIVSFRFERPEDYHFQAGQWFVVTFAGPDPAEPYEHHFSHSNAPSEPWLEFTTRLRQSEFKNALSALSIGSDVQIEGPYGSFVMPPEVERAAFLAGGIGVTCVRSILRWVAHVRALAGGSGEREEEPPVALREIVLLFANHSEDAIPFAAELGRTRCNHAGSAAGARAEPPRGRLAGPPGSYRSGDARRGASRPRTPGTTSSVARRPSTRRWKSCSWGGGPRRHGLRWSGSRGTRTLCVRLGLVAQKGTAGGR